MAKVELRPIIVIFATKELSVPEFFSATEPRDLTSYERRFLDDLLDRSRRETQSINSSGIIEAISNGTTPLAVEIVASGSKVSLR